MEAFIDTTSHHPGLLPCSSRRRRGGGGGEVSEGTGVIERGQRGRSDTGRQETYSVNHTLRQDLFWTHRNPI